jgi:hypothetical protein
MDLCHVSSRHLGDAVAPECRDNHTLQHPPVTLGRALLQPERNVLIVEAVGEFLDCDGPPVGVALGGGMTDEYEESRKLESRAVQRTTA